MLQASRKAVKREVKKAKNAWLSGVVSDLEWRDNPKRYWEGVRKTRGGLRGHVKGHTVQRFRNSEGKLCDSAAENAKALETHFEKVYNILSGVDGKFVSDLSRTSWIVSQLMQRSARRFKKRRRTKHLGML